MAEVAREVPQEILVDICLRLPVETLFRFKSISKQCCRLISDPWFINLYHRRFKLFYISDGEDRWSLCFKIIDLEGKVFDEFTERVMIPGDILNIAGRVDGLICFEVSTFPMRRFPGMIHQQFYVCNATTHKLLTIPMQSPFERPSERPRLIGFGYLSSTKEYKIMRCFSDKQCEIFSFLEGSKISCSSWKAIGEKFPAELPNEKFVFANQRLNWLRFTDEHSPSFFKWEILSFDMRTETFSVLCVPSDAVLYWNVYLINLGGSLSLVSYSISGLNCIIWRIKDYDKCIWIKAYEIDCTTLISAHKFHAIQPMVNGELLMIRWCPYGVVHLYNSGNKELRVLRTKGSIAGFVFII